MRRILVAPDKLTTHTGFPFGKGRGGCTCDLASEGVKAVLNEPTSLNRGEGLVTGLTGEVGGGEGERESDGGSGG